MKVDFANAIPIKSTQLTMRRLVRFEKSIDLLESSYRPSPRSLFVCLSCRTRLATAPQRFALSTSASRRAQSGGKVPFTEKIRRRIWGTESPPGQEDPYGGLSALDQTKRKKTEQRSAVETEVAVQRGAAVAQPDTTAYVPATTWDGLEQVGGLRGWEEETLDDEERFKG